MISNSNIKNINWVILFIAVIIKNFCVLGENYSNKNIDVDFSYDGYTKLRNSIFSYLKQSDNTPYIFPLLPENLGIFLFDIDSDGDKEIFLYINHVGYCGSSGCDFMILKKDKNCNDKNNSFIEIFLVTSYKKIIVLPTKSLGYHDLVFTTRTYGNIEQNQMPLKKVVWRWNGHQYTKFMTES